MKTAMVWGAQGGIGQALVKKLQADDWEVLSVSRTARAEDKSLEADVSKSWEVEKAVHEAAMEVDQVNLWIYAVGDITSEKVDQMDPEAWARILDANLSGAYLAVHHSLSLLSEDATLVFVGAVSERLRLPGLSAYAAAKVGLEAFTEALSKEERKKRIILVRPSAVDTPLWEKVPLKLPSDAPPPEKVAGRILEAVHDGHKGQLDLTG
jgi:NAD(P)-dependent dehydrogenase (short-subunit alcohol dehydrogenase family)